MSFSRDSIIGMIQVLLSAARRQFHQHVYTQFFCAQKTKKLFVFENEFHDAFSNENCLGCAICKLHLAVLVAICKLQLAVHKKASKKLRIKMLMKLTPGSLKFKKYIFSSKNQPPISSDKKAI